MQTTQAITVILFILHLKVRDVTIMIFLNLEVARVFIFNLFLIPTQMSCDLPVLV